MSKTKARAMWRSLFDVRRGEYRRTAFMSLYLFFVMVAYYILKPVSAAPKSSLKMVNPPSAIGNAASWKS